MNLSPQEQQERLNAIRMSFRPNDEVSVLIVDDSVEDSEMAKELLELSGLDVAIAYNCAIAEQLLSNNGFSVVFMDWKLVGKSGMEALDSLKKISSGHIIILTGFASEMDAAQALKHGASAVMSKPLTNDHIRLIFGNITHPKP